MSAHPAFELLRQQPVPALHLTLEEYRHVATGAMHYHLAHASQENVFMVALRTVPMDSTGVAHILEHTVLCGSRRYPVRDPFFMMLRRSLNTFMNALTSSDWTAYPFASQNRKDFDNLLQVYLDAVFFPNLDPLDFAQEGHRVEVENPDDPDSPLVYKGVVFNEMKGAMSSVSSVLWEAMDRHLFPTTTYHFNSGGDPAVIPDLTWEQLKTFHATHYHPSNAIFMTFGDIPAAEHHARFETLALGEFGPAEHTIAVPDEQRLPTPVRHEDVYAASQADCDAGDHHHVVLGWLLGHSTDLDEALQAQFLTGLLLENSASPLQKLLETTPLGAAPSPLCGLDDTQKELSFVCGLQGCRDNTTEDVETAILDTLQAVESDGFAPDTIEATLHQIELHRREISGDSFPYGLQLLLQGLTNAAHYGDPVDQLDIDAALQRLRRDAADPAFPGRLIRRLLLDNSHRITLTLHPDATLADRREQAERDRLAALARTLDHQDRQALIAQAEALEARQTAEDDPDSLPRVTLADVPGDVTLPPLTTHGDGPCPLTTSPAGTNGLVYAQAIMALPPLDADELRLLPYYTQLLTEVGLGGTDYLTVQQRQSSIAGDIHLNTTLRAHADDRDRTPAYLVLSAKSLHRNAAALADLMADTLAQPRFDETSRLRELISARRKQAENRITGQGHSLAMAAASADLSPLLGWQHRLGGLAGLQALQATDDRLRQDETAAEALFQRLAALHAKLADSQRQLLLVTEDDMLSEQQTLFRHRLGQTGAAGTPDFAFPDTDAVGDTAWLAKTDVHFCARAYPTVAANHPDAPLLTVLAGLLRNRFLHRAIREQGGAYGGGASHDSGSGAFRFFSYRDPRLGDTLADFDAAIEWVLDTPLSAHWIEEAVLGVIAALDKPGSPAGDARRHFHNTLYGRDHDFLVRFRQRAMASNEAELKRVARDYLVPDRARTAVIVPQHRQTGLDDLSLTLARHTL